MTPQQIIDTYHASRIKSVAENLARRNIHSICVATADDAFQQAIDMIQPQMVISQGGSVTLDQIGLRDYLLTQNQFTFIDPYASGLSADERIERRRQGLICDLFFCSANAITLDGIIINRDGMGNRVAAMIFGPRRIVIIAGANKIVSDVDAGITRINELAAPMNAIRLNRQPPCVQATTCTDCRQPDRLCAATSLIEWQVDPKRMTVILSAEPLGL